MIHHGDCLEVLPTFEPESIDAIVTDPPYGLEFMGKEWDGIGRRIGHPLDPSKAIEKDSTAEPRAKDNPWQKEATGYGAPKKNARCRKCDRLKFGQDKYRCQCELPDWDTRTAEYARQMQTWHEAWAREAFRVAKPGAHLLAFGGTRTYHRLASAIEDAGWEIRDTLVWAYASGFPKSLDVSKAIDKAVAGATPGIEGLMALAGTDDWQGWGTALKPAWEPIVLARKPLRGTVAGNVLAYGTGALNIDATRIGTGDGGTRDGEATASTRYGERGIGFQPTPGPRGGDALGRWPANVILTDPIFDGDAAGVVGGGETVSGKMLPTVTAPDTIFGQGGSYTTIETYGDSGTYSRFFLVPKAARSDREPVLGGIPEAAPAFMVGLPDPRMDRPQERKARANVHPTVKPTELMRHLVRLVTPPGGIVLDPFLGSGTTALAAETEGFRWVGIEREAEYVAIAEARLNGTQRGLGLVG